MSEIGKDGATHGLSFNVKNILFRCRYAQPVGRRSELIKAVPRCENKAPPTEELLCLQVIVKAAIVKAAGSRLAVFFAPFPLLCATHTSPLDPFFPQFQRC